MARQYPYSWTCGECKMRESVQAGRAGWANRKLRALGWLFVFNHQLPDFSYWLCPTCAKKKAEEISNHE